MLAFGTRVTFGSPQVLNGGSDGTGGADRDVSVNLVVPTSLYPDEDAVFYGDLGALGEHAFADSERKLLRWLEGEVHDQCAVGEDESLTFSELTAGVHGRRSAELADRNGGLGERAEADENEQHGEDTECLFHETPFF
jgi:hypothetical protein